MGDADYLMALELQKLFDLEDGLNANDELETINKREVKRKRELDYDDDLNSTNNIVHPEWETLDPTPDMFALFSAFDNKFFQGRLKCVTLEWSKRMYSCAGICYSRRSALGMAITIRLSEPLLKLRTRKDLIETLLHEMIHAYCSVLGIREGNGGHGPNFKKIMNGINKVAGTNITVYHTFHDEVDVYKTHWWRCNGICQNRAPFFGFVKRTSNRAPSANDIWWSQHLKSCGGSFLKVREPNNKMPKGAIREVTLNPKNDLRKYFGQSKNTLGSISSINDLKSPVKTNGVFTTPTSTIVRQPTNNLRNIVGFNDLTGEGGYSLNTAHQNTKSKTNSIDKNQIRDIWSKRFPSTSSNTSKDIPNDTSSNDAKELALPTENKLDTITSEDESEWKQIDDEIMLKEVRTSIIDITSDDDDDDDKDSNDRNIKLEPVDIRPIVKQTSEEKQNQIKQEILDSDGDMSDDDIEIIDADFDDDLVNASVDMADTSLIEDLFGEDTLLKEFKRENYVIPRHSHYQADPQKDIVTCPICQNKITRETFSEHLDGCVGISNKIVKPSSSLLSTPKRKKGKTNKTIEQEEMKVLRNAGYEDADIEEAIEIDDSGLNRRRGLDNFTHSCPVCALPVDVDMINEHLDICLANK